MKQDIIIIGASSKREKYGNKAVRAYQRAGWSVYPVNPNEHEIEGIPCFKRIEDIPKNIITVSLYVPPSIGEQLVESMASKGVKEVYVNPGTESEHLLELLEKNHVKALRVCSIRAVGDDPALL